VAASVVFAVKAVMGNFRIHIQPGRKGRDRHDRRVARKEGVYWRHVVIIPIPGAAVSQAGINAGSEVFGEIPLEQAVVASFFQLEAGSLRPWSARSNAVKVPGPDQKVIEPDICVRLLVADFGEAGFELASPEEQRGDKRRGPELDPGEFIGG